MMCLNWYTRTGWFLCGPEKRQADQLSEYLALRLGPVWGGMVYAYLQRYPELAYYRNFIIQQDKKFIWPAVQMYDIGYHAMCVHHCCPFTMTDQALMATVLDAAVVKVLACKWFHCWGFDHLVDGCPFPQTASLETVETWRRALEQGRYPSQAQPNPAHLLKWTSGSIMEEKAVTTISRTDVHFSIANGPMSAAIVSSSTLLPNVVVFGTVTTTSQ